MTTHPHGLHIDDGGPEASLPVVFLHSAAGNAEQFTPQLAHLRSKHRAIAIDLPGHARSPIPDSFAIEHVAQLVIDGLEHLRLDRFVLVGHSWGGGVATAIAGKIPERIAGLFLLDPVTDGRLIPPEAAKGMMDGLHRDYDGTIHQQWNTILQGAQPATREQVMRDLETTPPEVVTGTLESILAFDPVAALQRYPGPKQTVVTANDRGPDAYQNRAPGFVVTPVEGTSHWLQLDAPEKINALLDAFLKLIDRAVSQVA